MEKPKRRVTFAEVPPSSNAHSFRQVLLPAEEDNLTLASEKLHTALQNLQVLETALGATNEEQVCKERKGTIREKEKEISLLRESLRAQKEETEGAINLWKTDSDMLHRATQEICRLEKALDGTKSWQMELKTRDETIRENKKEISQLRKNLTAQRKQTERVQDLWRKENEKLNVAQQNICSLKTALEATKTCQVELKKRDEIIRKNQQEISRLYENVKAQRKEIETVQDLRSKESDLLKTAQEDIQRLETALEATNSGQECRKREEMIKENEKEISLLRERLHAEKEETKRVVDRWKIDNDLLKKAHADIICMHNALKTPQTFQMECKRKEQQIREKEKEISQLQQSLTAQRNETEKIRDLWSKRSEELKTAQQDIQRLETALEAAKADQECKNKGETLREKENEISLLRDGLTAQKEETQRVRDLQTMESDKLHMAEQKICSLETSLEASKEECKRMDQMIAENNTEISLLCESLRAQKEETERVHDLWTEDCVKMKAAFDDDLKMVKSVCETQRTTDLQQIQSDCQRKVSQLQEQITEQDQVISSLRVEIKARTEELLTISSQLEVKQLELDQSINKCRALEEKRGFWKKKKKPKRCHEEEKEKEEAAACSAQAGQQKEKKERKWGFWSLARKKKSSHSDRKEKEDAACPTQAGQQ